MEAACVDFSKLAPGQWVVLKFAEPGRPDVGCLTDMAREDHGIPGSDFPVKIDSIDFDDNTFFAVTPKGFLQCEFSDIRSLNPSPEKIAHMESLLPQPRLPSILYSKRSA